MVEYHSQDDFNSRIVQKLTSPDFKKYLKYEMYNNDHYNYFENNKVSKAEAVITEDF